MCKRVCPLLEYGQDEESMVKRERERKKESKKQKEVKKRKRT